MNTVKTLKLLAFLVLTLANISAYAVQTTVPHVRLWGGDIANDQYFLDLDNKISNGVSPAVASWGCSDSAPGTSANIKTTKIRLESRDSTSGAIAWFAIETDVSPTYDATYELGPTCPIGPFSVAIANLKTSKVILVASSVGWGFSGSPTHHLSAYNITSANGAKLWTRAISDIDPLSLGPTSGWIFSESLSGVGDFLKGDGIDEIRLVYIKQNTDKSTDWNYVYLDAGTGIQIPNASKSYHVIAP